MKLTDVPTVLLVASGKGGVGKTTVASDIARAAHKNGNSVGLIDADISTPNSPSVVGDGQKDLSNERLSTHDSLVPPVVDGIQVISKGVVLPEEVPILSDGEWRANVVVDYIDNVDWDADTDLVVIDSPPGTGEEVQTVLSAAAPDIGVVVTTPHPSSLRDAKKTHELFKQSDLDHVALLNMAYIPSEDIASQVGSQVDFTQLDGVGDTTADDIITTIHDDLQSRPLFGHNPDEEPDFPLGFEAVVPYTERRDRRVAELDALLRNHVDEQEAEA